MEIQEIGLALIPWILIFGVFWFLFIRPQKKKRQQREEMLDKLEIGDRIVTIGGIKGTITEIGEENGLTIEIASEVEIQVDKNAIGNIENN